MPSQFLFLVVYVAVGVSDHFWLQERWQFLSNGSFFHWPFCHHCYQSIYVGIGGWKSQNNWQVTSIIFIFVLPLSCTLHLFWASRKMLCLPRMLDIIHKLSSWLLTHGLTQWIFVVGFDMQCVTCSICVNSHWLFGSDLNSLLAWKWHSLLLLKGTWVAFNHASMWEKLGNQRLSCSCSLWKHHALSIDLISSVCRVYVNVLQISQWGGLNFQLHDEGRTLPVTCTFSIVSCLYPTLHSL